MGSKEQIPNDKFQIPNELVEAHETMQRAMDRDQIAES